MNYNENLLDELNWYTPDSFLSETNSDKSSGKVRSERKGSTVKGKQGRRVRSKFIDSPNPISGQTWEKQKASSINNLREKLSLLEERDKNLRSSIEKQFNINTAVKTVGTCPDMCPEKERIMRELKNIVSIYECYPNSITMNPNLAVKEYARSSANQEEPLPHELRPVPVLTMTVAHLMNNIICQIDSSVDNLAGWYDFCCNRLRAIRKDIVQQHLCDLETVTIVEQCARFHIICFDRLWGVDSSVFDEKINTEHLMSCLKALMNMYEDLRKHGTICPNEAEFNAYMILLKINSTDLLWEYLNFPLEVQKSVEVMEAVRIHTAFHNNMFTNFFNYVRESKYLNACLMQLFFQHVRVNGLETIVKSHGHPKKQSKVSLTYIMKLLKFDSSDDTVSFCEACGIPLVDNCDFKISRFKFTPHDSQFKIVTPSSLITSKRISVFQAVVGSESPLPFFKEYTVHNSFNDNNTLKEDAIDASDQEEKMLFDDIKRKMQLKNLVNSTSSENILNASIHSEIGSTAVILSAKSEIELQVEPLREPAQISNNVEFLKSSSPTVNEFPVFHRQPIQTEPEMLLTQMEHKYSESSSDEDVHDNDEDFDEPDSLNLNIIQEPESVESTSSESSSSKSSCSSLQFIDPESAQNLENKDFLENSSAIMNELPGIQYPVFKMSPEPDLSEIITTSNENLLGEQISLNDSTGLGSPSNIKEAVKSPITEPSSAEKLRRKLSENLRRISARKYGRIWRKKVRLLRMRTKFIPFIHHLNMRDYLHVWGHSSTKPKAILNRLNSSQKFNAAVNSLLERNIFVIFPSLREMGSAVCNVLGSLSSKQCVKEGTFRGLPVYWKLVVSLPLCYDVCGSLILGKLEKWFSQAFFVEKNMDIGGVKLFISRTGIPVFIRLEILNGLKEIERAKNLSALFFLRVPGIESRDGAEKRLQEIISLRNHPLPVCVLNVSNVVDNLQLVGNETLSHFSQLHLNSPETLYNSMLNLAVHSNFIPCKVEYLLIIIERMVERFLDSLHEDTFNHRGLYNTLSNPNNVLRLYNVLLDKISEILISYHGIDAYGTFFELKSRMDAVRIFKGSKGPISNFEVINQLKDCIKKLKLPELLWPPKDSYDVMFTFKNYCRENGVPNIFTSLIRLINPPDIDNTEIDLQSHLLSLEWLHIIEIILKARIEILRPNQSEFDVLYEDNLHIKVINSHWWLSSEYVPNY